MLSLVVGPVSAVKQPLKAKPPASLVAGVVGASLFLVRIYAEQPCAKHVLTLAGAQSGEYYRRAIVVWKDLTVSEACWLTMLGDGNVDLTTEGGIEFSFPMKSFRPERKA